VNFFCRVSLRTKLLVIACILGASTAAAGLAQVLPLDKTTIVCLWIGALISGSFAMFVLGMTGYRLILALNLLSSRAHSIADGDLTGLPLLVNVHDELGALARSIDRMQHSLQEIVSTIADASASVERDISGIAHQGAEAFTRTSQQSTQTNQAASAMQEMSISIFEVSSNAQTAADQAREAAAAAHDGGVIVEELLAGMNTISASVSQTAETVQRLGTESEQIIRIVNVIEEIADKTNLLALNAAIEAARAGEHGRGFAVVAGEVRRLAESTRNATSEIAQTIDTITSSTNAAVQAMSSGTERVARGLEITARAGESIHRIIAATDQVESMIAQIATASTEQSVTAQEFSQNLEVINRLTEDLNAATPITRAGIQSVEADALRLHEYIGRFRIDHEPPSSQSSCSSPCKPAPTAQSVPTFGD
jgi:methyl-accepting chemotaxis protein